MSRRGAVAAALEAGRKAAMDHVEIQASSRIQEYVAELDGTEDEWTQATKDQFKQVSARAIFRALNVAVETAAAWPDPPDEEEAPF